MKCIYSIDSNDYQDCKNVKNRNASRAIIIKDNKIALIWSSRFNDYKFPGGGLEFKESPVDALIREVKEETGLTVILSSIKEYGYTIEKHKSDIPNTIFIQHSNYYTCNVLDNISDTKLDKYEREYGFTLKYIDIDEAISNNEYIIKNKDISLIPWINRDTAVLKHLKENGY